MEEDQRLEAPREQVDARLDESNNIAFYQTLTETQPRVGARRGRVFAE
jgi:hypothetical protein